ncbi:DUF4279 domain-containing protein [Stenotrophomonas sp. S41]|uniref:DUF4279 domain-containing protein n=1 Tax=Stenotrophomonas sp. S41 TaxID=2767464 RepID=UPI00190BF104|nr:DUF4279 domain-containing protein [Stenotrophomonas sp. S41]MBK0014556.1 DUF4279 domain-containing protein [Stenotrophomonas sp. S41]
MNEGVRYSISIRIAHPEMDMSGVCEDLGLVPDFSYSAGDARVTPKGKPIGGVRDGSYWLHSFVEGNDGDVESSLEQIVRFLSVRQEFFEQIARSGGRSELFIGWFSSENTGFNIGNSILRKLVDLSIDLSFDIYPE